MADLWQGMAGINLGDLPSWILVLLIGLGLRWADTNGILQQTHDLGNLMILAGLLLGGFYFYTDISNKVGR